MGCITCSTPIGPWPSGERCLCARQCHDQAPRSRIGSQQRADPSSPRGDRQGLHGGRRSWLPIVGGLGCLGGVLVLGVVVHHGATPVDEAARRTLRGWASQQHLTRHVVGAIAQERGRYHGSYVSAALPLACAAILAVGSLRRGHGRGRWWSTLRARAWPWLLWSLVLLCSLPLVEALRVVFDRPDPTESADPSRRWGPIRLAQRCWSPWAGSWAAP